MGASKTLAPRITWPSGLSFPKAQSKVVWQGKGASLKDGQPLLLNVFVESLKTHEVLHEHIRRLAEVVSAGPRILGNDLYNILLKARVGTRVLSVAPSQGEFAASPPS